MKKGNIFDSIKITTTKSSNFDLSHDVKLSFNMGELVPIMVMECVPGDRIKIGCESLIRFAPLLAPMMHRVDATIHYFFVPNRLVWPGWEDYVTNTEVGGSLPAFPVIIYDNGGFPQYSRLCDYMGLPEIPNANGETVSAIPFAAYQKIWNDYYRDQNLIAEIDTELPNGTQSSADTNSKWWVLRHRAWEHDYFTAALPFAQKGDPVSIPIGSFSDVEVYRTGNAVVAGFTQITDNATAANFPVANIVSPDFPNTNSLYANTSSLAATSTTINDLRYAYRLQEWLEKAARGGSRYIENILIHFGVRSSDKRLQRPEYITGVKTPVVISEVLNTSGTLTEPQGNMAGHAFATISGKYGSFFCEEHGYVIGIMSVLPKTAYQQGIPKHFLKINDPFELYWPTFAHLGEQAVTNNEVYVGVANGSETFGYVPRYAEYKFMQNRVAGAFKDTLDYWHMGRIFSSQPALNQTFIECKPTHRVFANEAPGDEKLYVQVLNKVYAQRPMPKFGTPTF